MALSQKEVNNECLTECRRSYILIQNTLDFLHFATDIFDM